MCHIPLSKVVVVVVGVVGDTVRVDWTHCVVVGTSGSVVEVLSKADNVDVKLVELLELYGVGATGSATVEEGVIARGVAVLADIDVCAGDGEGNGVVRSSLVTVTATVVADSDSSTTFVDMMIAVEGGGVLGEAVTVVVSWVVCVTVWRSSVIVAESTAVEPPSTATTE